MESGQDSLGEQRTVAEGDEASAFPEEQAHFGDVAVGATSTYVEVRHGVYSYAAYRLEVDGSVVTQPVIDWVGEQPMEGRSFTYSLAVDRYRVELVAVARDN
jgi:hypothetical protein